MKKLIEFKNVSKTYTMGEVQIHALEDVSFSINEGEFVIIAGASGAGKARSLICLVEWIPSAAEKSLSMETHLPI